MKILMICDFYSENQTYQDNLLAKYYALAGHEVVVITSTYTEIFKYVNNRYDKNQPENVSYDDSVKIYRLKYKTNILHKIKGFAGIKIKKIISNEKPDVIYMHGIIHNLKECINYVELNPKCRMIMDSHADFSNSGNNWLSINVLHKIIKKIYLKKYIKYIDKLFVVTPDTGKFVSSLYNVPSGKIELLPLGYDSLITEQVKKEYNREQIRRDLGIAKDDFVVITGGKIDYKKKTDILLDAVRKINDKRIKIIVFGTIVDEFKEIITQKCNGLDVIFTGWQNNIGILKLMLAADIAVYPASQSVIWQQSIGMGLPLIVGNVGNQDARYLNRNNNVINLSPDQVNAECLSNEISKIFNDSCILQKMKIGAEKTAHEFLDYKIICNKTLEN